MAKLEQHKNRLAYGSKADVYAALVATTRSLVALVAVAVGSALAASDERSIADLVKEDIALEAAECGAYFAFSAEGIKRSMPDGKEKDKEVADWMRFSSEALNLSTSLGTKERTKAASELAMENIKRITKASYENWTIAAAE